MGTLMHVFDLLWRQDPESFPFRQPVDPKALGIPVSVALNMCGFTYVCISLFNLQDYFEIIKNPIDLTTIRNRLENGEYKNGWEVCNTSVHVCEWRITHPSFSPPLSSPSFALMST